MSDLKSMVQKTIQSNLRLLGTIRATGLYIFAPPPTYFAEDGSMTSVDAKTYFSVDFVATYLAYFVGKEFQYPIPITLSDFNLTKTQASESLIGGEPIYERDKKGLISKLDLPTKPLLAAVIQIASESIKYQIKGLNTDPTNSIWILHLRPIDG